jgi:hypothetical protein
MTIEMKATRSGEQASTFSLLIHVGLAAAAAASSQPPFSVPTQAAK